MVGGVATVPPAASVMLAGMARDWCYMRPVMTAVSTPSPKPAARSAATALLAVMPLISTLCAVGNYTSGTCSCIRLAAMLLRSMQSKPFALTTSTSCLQSATKAMATLAARAASFVSLAHMPCRLACMTTPARSVRMAATRAQVAPLCARLVPLEAALTRTTLPVVGAR